MSIVRAPRPDRDFTVIPNAVLRDERLSYRARGVLAAVLSRPDHWRTDAVSLARGGAEGRDAIRKAFAELRDHGYLHTVRFRRAGGRFETVSVVFDEPRDQVRVDEQLSLVTPETDSQAPAEPPADEPAGHTGNGFPGAGQPAVGAPASGFPGPLGTTDSKNTPPTPRTAGGATCRTHKATGRRAGCDRCDRANHRPPTTAPRLTDACPRHPGQLATNCGGCRADQLAEETA